jgi:response regulator RpfG family c-di-GMP phosphodiesterase
MKEPLEKDRYTVLFVDDEENVLRSLKRLFADEEYNILTALSGEEGLALLSDGSVAVIISDQRMPQMTGAEFLEKARKLVPDSMRIMLTGHSDIGAAIQAINKGALYRYITKPWNPDELISTVRNAVERYRLAEENRFLTELTQRQNEELKKWSSELEVDVQNQTIELTRKNQELEELNEKLTNNFKQFVVTMSNLIELRDSSTASHSNNVAWLSERISGSLGLGDSETAFIKIAAQLHDIGKMGVPDAVILKDPRTLTHFERIEYEKHPIRGQAVVDHNETLRETGVLIRHHHECYDGTGFPDRLRGSSIPLGSRIIAVADVFDRLSLTHTTEWAMESLAALLGTRLDPNLHDHLVRAVTEWRGSVSSPSHIMEMELHPDKLLSGMTLSRDVRSGTGVLLLPQGATLTANKIGSIRRYYALDPPETGVHVWAEKR